MKEKERVVAAERSDSVFVLFATAPTLPIAYILHRQNNKDRLSSAVEDAPALAIMSVLATHLISRILLV